jgi:hypothetical protein
MVNQFAVPFYACPYEGEHSCGVMSEIEENCDSDLDAECCSAIVHNSESPGIQTLNSANDCNCFHTKSEFNYYTSSEFFNLDKLQYSIPSHFLFHSSESQSIPHILISDKQADKTLSIFIINSAFLI